jgi:anaerobic selenocysteine-containing dehydrogenase
VIRTEFHTCPLCEAACGLELRIEDDRITRVRGDREHVLSKGFICPKGSAFNKLADDPDRLRRPMIRTGTEWTEVSWDDAFAAVDDGLRRIVDQYGPDAVALYLGNPNAHTLAGGLYLGPLIRSLRTKRRFSASTVDQMPKHVSCGHMFGNVVAIPVPDIDRTDFMVLLGANPWESNGSLCTAPDFPGRLKALQARGGSFIVVDPRRTKTAAEADEHLAIRPGTDALLLMALVHTLFEEDLVALGRMTDHVNGVEDVHVLAKDFPPEAVSAACGIPAERIRLLARQLAEAPTAVVYGRIGTCTVAHGTLASWLVDVVNVLTGNFDSPGGAMFPLAPHVRRGAGKGKGFTTGRWTSRVRGAPEVLGELPAATLAEEIDTPGDGQIRALFTFAGNPALSTPNSGRLEAALAELEFMVSVDPYLNETTRHAHVILPPTDPARVGHYDFGFLSFSVRNAAVYNRPLLPEDPGGLDDCAIYARLMLIAMGQGPHADPALADEALLAKVLEVGVTDTRSPAHGQDASAVRAKVFGNHPAERLVDAMVRTGAYGDGFGAQPDGLSVERMLAAPHGIDLGPLEPRVPEVLRTASGRVELCPPPFAADVDRLRASLAEHRNGGMVLVGRRHLRSNNSWLHNVHVLVKGKERCTLQIHSDDAARLGLVDGAQARVRSRVGEVVAPVEVTDDVMPGVVSLPHGWGHGQPGTRMQIAADHAGVNSNVLTDDMALDPLSGNAVLNGIPVELEPV